jgi:RND family efflux transporter MFP subunit
MKAFHNLLILSAGIGILAMGCHSSQKQPKKMATGETIAVSTCAVSPAQSNIVVNTTGILSSDNETRYSFKVGGVIEKIYVEEGDFVKKGMLLATLKKDEINAGYNQAGLALEKARRDLERAKSLYNDSVATLEQLQNAKTAYEVAGRQVDALGFNKDYMYIYAVADGYVAKKLASTREIVGEGMPVLLVNENNEGAWILKAGLSDKDWALTEVGNTVQVALDAYSDKPQQGVVVRKSIAAEANSGSLEVEIKLFCKNIKPAFGMFARAAIKTSHNHLYTSIPYGALVEADGNTGFVYVPAPQGKVTKKPIVIAHFDNNAIYVQSGLENVSSVIVSNSAFLNEQSNITILKSTTL